MVKAKLVKTPDIAPFELLNGRNIPRQKSPRMGPPIILRVFIYLFICNVECFKVINSNFKPTRIKITLLEEEILV